MLKNRDKLGLHIFTDESIEEWDDSKVKTSTFKRDVFLSGDIKVLGSMTNLKFDISLF